MATVKKAAGSTRLNLDALVSKFNKDAGDDIIVKGSDLNYEHIPRISSGIPAFDVMLGGGWPMNQWAEIIGDESSGKTAVMLKTLAHNQAVNPDFECLWVAAEGFEPTYAKSIGVDLDRTRVVLTNIMEDVYTLVVDVIDNRAADMVVIDSLPAMISKEEEEKDMDSASISPGARLTGKFFRKYQYAGRRSLTEEDRPCTCFMINQWREKIGVMYGDNRTTPGGRGKNYHFYTRVEVKRDEWLDDGKKNKIGQAIGARAIKNKSYKPQQVAQVDFYFTDFGGFHQGDFDVVKQIVNMAVVADIIERKGAWFSYGEDRWQGKEACTAAVREDLDLQQTLHAAVFKFWLPQQEYIPMHAATAPKKRRVRRGS